MSETHGLVYAALMAVEDQPNNEALLREARAAAILADVDDDFTERFGDQTATLTMEFPTDPTSTDWTVWIDVDDITLKANEASWSPDRRCYWLDDEPVRDLVSLGLALQGQGFHLIDDTTTQGEQ